MKTRSVLIAAALATTGILAVPGQAAVKPYCRLVLDAPDDTNLAVSLGLPGEGMDIISADVASSATVVTATIRVKRLAATDVTKTWVRWTFYWGTPGAKDGTRYVLYAERDVQGATTFRYGRGTTAHSASSGPNALANGVVDEANNEIRIWVKIADLKAAVPDGGNLKVGQRWNKFSVETTMYYTFQLKVDSADSLPKTFYPAGGKSCAKNGS